MCALPDEGVVVGVHHAACVVEDEEMPGVFGEEDFVFLL